MAGNFPIDDLIRWATDPIATPEQLVDWINPAVATLGRDDQAGAEALLRRLAEELINGPTRPDLAAMIALYCGAMVERGLDPSVALPSMLDRLEQQVLPDAIRFVATCRGAAEDDLEPTPEVADPGAEPEQPDPILTHGARMAELVPLQGQSFQALESLSRAAAAMLTRSAPMRQLAWSRPEFRLLLDQLGGQYGHAGMLWTVAHVLDDEPLVVLHPAQGKGYQVRISGLADNFQLHTLLADALIGRFAPRWLRGNRPTSAEVAAAGSGPIDQANPGAPTRGNFNLWTYRGLQRDAPLPDAGDHSAHWVWNEGVPADIPLFEGTRVVLLGPPPYPQSWTTTRKFPQMAGRLQVEDDLSRGETRAWLERISRAI